MTLVLWLSASDTWVARAKQAFLFVPLAVRFHTLAYPLFHFTLQQNRWYDSILNTKAVSEYDQEIPQSQTADNPMAPQERATQPSRDTKKAN